MTPPHRQIKHTDTIVRFDVVLVYPCVCFCLANLYSLCDCCGHLIVCCCFFQCCMFVCVWVCVRSLLCVLCSYVVCLCVSCVVACVVSVMLVVCSVMRAGCVVCCVCECVMVFWCPTQHTAQRVFRQPPLSATPHNFIHQHGHTRTQHTHFAARTPHSMTHMTHRTHDS